jgi:hypothetical protein
MPETTTPAPFVLPPAVYSPQLLEAVIYDIEVYLDWYRQNQVKKQVGAAVTEEPAHSAETVLVIEAWLQGRQPTLDSLGELVDTLRGLDLPVVQPQPA